MLAILDRQDGGPHRHPGGQGPPGSVCPLHYNCGRHPAGRPTAPPPPRRDSTCTPVRRKVELVYRGSQTTCRIMTCGLRALSQYKRRHAKHGGVCCEKVGDPPDMGGLSHVGGMPYVLSSRKTPIWGSPGGEKDNVLSPGEIGRASGREMG